MRFNNLYIFGLLALLVTAAPAVAKLRIITSLPVYADAVRQIGGNRVSVQSVARELQDPHFIQPTPWIVTRLARADAYVTTGLDLELWAGPLLEASANTKVFMSSTGYVDVSQGIDLLQIPQGNVTRQAGDVHMMGNPHYFYSPSEMLVVAETIAFKLSDIDPKGAEAYATGLQNYQNSLGVAIVRWKRALAPYAGTEVVAFHNSFPYFERFSGLVVMGHIEPKPGINPSGGHLARLTIQMKRRKTKLVLHEPFYNRHYSEAVASRTGATVVEFVVQPGPKTAPTYVAVMDANVEAIVKALAK